MCLIHYKLFFIESYHIDKLLFGIHPIYKYSIHKYVCGNCGKIIKKKFIDPKQVRN